MDAAIASLKSLPQSKWNLHEKVFCQILGMKPKEGLSVRVQLNNLLSVLKAGGSGSRRDGTWKPTGIGPIDLGDMNMPNQFNLHYCKYGQYESFETSAIVESNTSMYIPRYFTVGNGKHITAANQVTLMKHVTGEAQTGLEQETRERRQQTWQAWYQKNNENGFTSYERNDLSLLGIRDSAGVFQPTWPTRFI